MGWDLLVNRFSESSIKKYLKNRIEKEISESSHVKLSFQLNVCELSQDIKCVCLCVSVYRW